MISGIRIRLANQWQIIWKKWSVRFNALGLMLLTYLTASPDAIINAWNMLPEEIKVFIPVKYSLYITVTLFGLGLVSQYIKQEKLERERLQREFNGKA